MKDRINHQHPLMAILARIEIVDEFIECVEAENEAGLFGGLKSDEFTAQLQALFDDTQNPVLLKNIGQAVLNEVIEFREVLMRDAEPYRPELLKMGVLQFSR